jgi:hypothetical protein
MISASPCGGLAMPRGHREDRWLGRASTNLRSNDTPSNGGTRSRLLNHADVGDNGTNFAPRKIEFRLVRCRRYGAFGKRLR